MGAGGWNRWISRWELSFDLKIELFQKESRIDDAGLRHVFMKDDLC